jgi:hypothetical protein
MVFVRNTNFTHIHHHKSIFEVSKEISRLEV